MWCTYIYPEKWWILREIRWCFFSVLLIVIILLYFIPRNKDRTSLEILKERYARGEITKEEFDRMKKDLS